MSSVAEQSRAGHSRDRPPPATLERNTKSIAHDESQAGAVVANRRRCEADPDLKVTLARALSMEAGRAALRSVAPTRTARQSALRGVLLLAANNNNNNISTDLLGQRRARTAAVATSQQPAAQPVSAGSRLDCNALVFAPALLHPRPRCQSAEPPFSCCLHFSLITSAQATAGEFPTAAAVVMMITMMAMRLADRRSEILFRGQRRVWHPTVQCSAPGEHSNAASADWRLPRVASWTLYPHPVEAACKLYGRTRTLSASIFFQDSVRSTALIHLDLAPET